MIEIPFVHCVDTEGPLNESDFDTWLRIKDICDINYEENFVSKVLKRLVILLEEITNFLGLLWITLIILLMIEIK